MARYSREIVREVLAANDIVDVIGNYLSLKPDGARRFKALSPFKNEKTPSFKVNQDRQTYHCFSTDQGGDLISFLMAVEGLSFSEALQKLADRAGIRLPAATQADQRADDLRTQLIAFNEFALAHFKKCLQDPMRGGTAQKYLENRALHARTMSQFGLGYAPDAMGALLEAARSKGYHDSVIEASGLAKRGERGGFYDFFRNRVMFPIRDISGNVVAFGGRDLGDSPAKYINSPETKLYKKSRTLYGLHEARDAIRKEGFAILVEGYFDLLRCFDAGIQNVVATCGTALTDEQAQLIRRYAPEVTLVYDGDAAGIRAALKGVRVLAAAGLGVRAAVLPGGQDPDDFVRAQGAGPFQQVLSTAADFVSFYVKQSASRAATIEGRTAIAHELFEIVRGIGDEIRADAYLKQIGKALGLSEWACQKEYEKLSRVEVRTAAPLQPREQAPAPLPLDEINFVAVLINDPGMLKLAEHALEEVPLPSSPLAGVLGVLFSSDEMPVAADFEDPDAQRLWTAAATAEPLTPEIAEDLVRKRVARLRRESLEVERLNMEEAIRMAQREADTARMASLLNELVRIGRSIEQLDPV